MWKSCKKRILALSTTEAEWIALAESFKVQKTVHKIFKEAKHVDRSWTIKRDIQAHFDFEGHRIQWSIEAHRDSLVHDSRRR